MKRAEQVGWILKHFGDVESDMSAIHRVDEVMEMDGPRFFRFARRLPAYQGVMRMYAEKQAAERRDRTGGRDVVPVAAGELSQIPGLAEAAAEGLVSFEKAS